MGGGGKAKRDMGGAGVTIVVTRTNGVGAVVALRHVQDDNRWSSCRGFGLYQSTVIGGRAGLWSRPIKGG